MGCRWRNCWWGIGRRVLKGGGGRVERSGGRWREEALKTGELGRGRRRLTEISFSSETWSSLTRVEWRVGKSQACCGNVIEKVVNTKIETNQGKSSLRAGGLRAPPSLFADDNL